MSFDQYSETPASNDLANYFQTGMAPSKVKNAGWGTMADLASRFAAIHTTGGTATAYTLTQTRQFGSLVAGLEVVCIPNATNTGAATFAPDGLTAKNIFANGVAAIAGMIVINVPMYLKYDGTQWNLLNPQRSTGSFTITLTGMTGTTTGTVNYSIGQDGKSCSIIVISNILGTSSATTMTGTGIPAAIQSGSTGANAGRWIGAQDASAVILAWMQGLNGATWTFLKGATQGAWTNSATNKGLSPFVTDYPL